MEESLTKTRIREVFMNALELSADARALFLESLGPETLPLRIQIEELLREHDSDEGFLDSPAALPRDFLNAEKPGDLIGRYRLLEQIGEGGAGVVYMAEQRQPVRRRVALKVIKLGMDTKNVIARFEAERQAVAMMDHPNIAQVFDGGATETGRPYFVMELIRGVRITDYCNQRQLPTEDRLRLFARVCQAIQHAHQKGIIHRDIKPSNILITEGDQGPAPKVIDFGIAKATEQPLTEKTLFTEFRSFIGTPAYMSPEQIEMAGGDVDTRSDIYSLGVLLYELLTGQTPFPPSLMGSGIEQFRRARRDREPELPSTRLNSMPEGERATTAQQRRLHAGAYAKLLRGELDWIVMKCIEKDRSRRYESAGDLCEDIQRFLDREPILARPPSTTYRLGKFLRRHRIAVGAGAVVFLSLLAASAFSIREARRSRFAEDVATTARIKAETESKRAQRNEARALLNEYVADITLGHEALAAGNYGRASDLLQKHVPRAGITDLRGFEWGCLWRLARGRPHRTLLERGGSIRSVAFSTDGKFIGIGGRDATLVLRADDYAKIASAPVHGLSIAFGDSSRLFIADQGSIHSLEIQSGHEQTLTMEAGAPLAISPDAKRLAAAARDRVRIFQIEPWKSELTFFKVSGPLAFSSDGNRLVAGARDRIAIVPLNGKGELLESPAPMPFGFFFQSARVLAFSPDGSRIFSARDKSLVVLDAKTGKELGTIPADGKDLHSSAITAVALSPDGQRIATASWDHSVKLWDTSNGELVANLQGHHNEVWSLAFSPDGKSLLSGAKDGGVFLWPLEEKSDMDFIAGDWQPLGFSNDEQKMFAMNRRGVLSEIDTTTGEAHEIWREPAGPGGFDARRFSGQFSASADFKTFAFAAPDRTVQIHERETRTSKSIQLPGPPQNIALAPDGKSLVVKIFGGASFYRDLAARTNYALPSEMDRVLFFPNSRKVVLFARGRSCSIWNCATHATEREIAFEEPIGSEGAISPDSRTLAVAAARDLSNTIEILDLGTGRSRGILAGHKQGIGAVSFSADGKTLASASNDGLKLWNLATMQEIFTFALPFPGRPVFSPLGGYLAFNTRTESGEGIRLLKATFPKESASRE